MKKRVIEFVVLTLEFWLLISTYKKFAKYVLILQNPANTFYDGIIVRWCRQ